MLVLRVSEILLKFVWLHCLNFILNVDNTTFLFFWIASWLYNHIFFFSCSFNIFFCLLLVILKLFDTNGKVKKILRWLYSFYIQNPCFPLKLNISTIVDVLWKRTRMKCSLLSETLKPRYVFPIACRDLFYSSSQPVSFITSLSVMTFRCSTVSVKVFWSAIRLPREPCCQEIWICPLVKRGFKMYASE